MGQFSLIGAIIFIIVIVLIVFVIKKVTEPKRNMKQENERLKRELSKFKNNNQ